MKKGRKFKMILGKIVMIKTKKSLKIKRKTMEIEMKRKIRCKLVSPVNVSKSKQKFHHQIRLMCKK